MSQISIRVLARKVRYTRHVYLCTLKHFFIPDSLCFILPTCCATIYTAANYSLGDKSKVVAGCVVHEEKLYIIGNNHYMPALLPLAMWQTLSQISRNPHMLPADRFLVQYFAKAREKPSITSQLQPTPATYSISATAQVQSNCLHTALFQY
jgi:hypothetical protein